MSLMIMTYGTVFANFFGRAHIASIQSIAQACLVLGSALGPFPFGFCRDTTGSFTNAFLVSAVVPLVLSVFVGLKGGRPPMRLSPSSSNESVRKQAIGNEIISPDEGAQQASSIIVHLEEDA